ncbi:MAG: hypothetical protein JWN70_1456 [Planctomycetaceae bacterium]|nr:hypothetical protein [Planctomycetaceae bacterium]
MLTKRHLAVLRAALQFFDEEMIPHGQDAMQYYFNAPPAEELKPGEVRELRDILLECELRYACCDLTASRLISQELSASVEDPLNMAISQAGQVATILLTARH